MGGPDGLLAHLAQLPDELIHKSSSHAFLSPKQALKIEITKDPDIQRLDSNEIYFEGDGWPPEEMSM